MIREALDIILAALEDDEPSFEFKGNTGNVLKPELMFALKPHIKPLQKPHPRIGVAGLSTTRTF